MDIFSKVKIGDKMSIEINDIDLNSKENNMLNTQLVDKRNESLYISNPIYNGKKYSLRKGQKITIFFYRKRGIYQFDAEVIKKISNNVITFEIKPIGKLKKIQRRDYYRLPIVMNAILKIYQNDELLEYKCITKDLSGGGVKIVCKNKIENLKNVVIDLYLDEYKIINLTGEVVRTIKNLESNKYELGIKFKEINESDRDEIFAYIFEKQRLMRKKGLI